jgi:hypothetical protein
MPGTATEALLQRDVLQDAGHCCIWEVWEVWEDC